MKFNKLVKLALVCVMSGSTLFSSMPVNVFANEEITKKEIDTLVEKTINDMTIREKIGQMIMVDFRQWNDKDYTVLDKEVMDVIDSFDLGGVILFAENVKETAQTTKLINDMQEVVEKDESNDIPLFITIDQEGGIVTRLGTGTNLPGNMAVGATRSKDNAYNTGKIIGSELNALGVNVNFAPTIDVNNNPGNSVIGVRSISSDPNLVSTLGTAMIKGMQSENVAVTAKHFPGHGDTAVDSHYGLPIVDKSLEELQKLEFVPFKAAIHEGVDMIMTAHIAMPQIEAEVVKSDKGDFNLPATLSKAIITDVLRNELGYEGIVITDALNMKAISENFTESEAVIKVINADVDIALMPTILRSTEDVKKLETIFADVEKAVSDKVIDEDTINKSVERILKLKLEKEIWTTDKTKEKLTLDQKIENANAVVGSEEHKRLEKQISEDAVTLLKNENNMLPFKPKKGETVLVIAPAADQTNSMVKSIKRLQKDSVLGELTILEANYDDKTSHIEENVDLKSKIDKADYIIVGSNVNDTIKLGKESSSHYVPSEAIIYANEKNKKSVLLSLRNPYDTAGIREAKAQIAIFGFKGDPNGPDSEAGNQLSAGPNLSAGIGAIFGDFIPKGKLPVGIPVIIDGKFAEGTYLPFGFGLDKWGNKLN